MSNNNDIPETWKWVTLDDIGIVVTGNTPSKKITEYYGNDIPFYKPTDLEQGINVVEAREYLSKLASSVARIIPENSVMVTSIGSTIGKTGVVKREGAINQQINAIIPFINPKYLYYYTITNFFNDELIEKSSATTIPIINKSKFESISFPLAPIEEQNRIVDKIEELFSELDKSSEELIKAKELTKTLVAKTTYNLFGDLNDHKYLSEVSEIIMGQSPSSNSYNISGLGLPLFQGKKEFTELYPIAEKWTTSPIRLAKENDILMSVRAPVGDVNISNIECCIGRGLCAIRFKGYYKFLFYYLNSIKEEIKVFGTGSTFSSISKDIISNIKVPFPKYDKQLVLINNLEDKLSNFNKLLNEIEAKIQNNVNFKSKILQDAFKGKLSQQYKSDLSVELLLLKISRLKENYIRNQIEIKKNKPKFIKMTKEKLSIIEVLKKHSEPINAEELWQQSEHERIDDFYEKLKEVEHLIVQDISKKPVKISLR